MKRNFEKENRNVDKGIEHAGFMLDRLSQVFDSLNCSLAPFKRADKSENLFKEHRHLIQVNIMNYSCQEYFLTAIFDIFYGL